MAVKKTTAPTAGKRQRRGEAKKSVSRAPKLRAVRWALRRARPHTMGELLAFTLAILGVLTLVPVCLALIEKHTSQSTGVAWCSVLLVGALASRTSARWLPAARSMTREKARIYCGSAFLLASALCLTWHVLVSALGFGDSYPIPGRFGSGVGGAVFTGILAFFGAIILFEVPVYAVALHVVSSLAEWVRQLRQRRLLDSASLEFADSPAVDLIQQLVRSDPTQSSVEPDRSHSSRDATASDARGRRDIGSEPGTEPGVAAPPIDIFKPSPKAPSQPLDVEYKSRRIQETLASFNVAARVVGHHSGPVVTQFDIQPERGVKVRRITELQNDLALALAAPTIRIQAPVPGKPVVGIEIPNSSATMVSLRELLESDTYRSMKSPLKVALGKDVAGSPSIIDLAKMPHLLIAGATGSGKSVCVNAIISCLLYHNRPEDVRLMMIDPKMVELTVYNGVPHLLSKVVTEMDKVVGVLQWALREMEQRYKLFADNTVRNVLRYNEKMEAAGQRRLPYIVLIVDELADLMMVAPEDVEDAICRLAQLARAAGIHLVIATQRPSVDVVTGLIKANFPARIAFAMTSQVDSRTILDTVGAEKLLGRGDMLYLPGDAPKPLRLQGAHVSDQEIEKLVEFWHRSPLNQVVQTVPEEEFAAAEKAANQEGDELLGEALRVVREYQHASVSLLQRRLKVGYSRAARIMDQLEERGVVGAADGSKQRPVFDDGGNFGAPID